MDDKRTNKASVKAGAARECTLEDVLEELERIEGSLEEISRAVKHRQRTVTAKPFYSVQDVCILLGLSRNLVNELAERKKDPLLFKRIAFKERGKFIAHEDLIRWVQDNSLTIEEWRRLKRGGSDEDV